MNSSSSTRRRFLSATIKAGGSAALAPPAWSFAQTAKPAQSASQEGQAQRQQWVSLLQRTSEPVLKALSERTLRQSMPVEAVAGHEPERAVGSQLEAFGRLLAGIAPWLEAENTADTPAPEAALRQRYRTWVQQAIASAVDPDSPDYMRFGQSAQTLVDASFLALALLRAPRQLLETMDARTRERLVKALVAERVVQPPFNNWLLFAALNEVLLRRLDAAWDRLRIDYALREHAAWYLGDGIYGDGPHFHADFYNSIVIHPYLLAVIDEVIDEKAWTSLHEPIRERARRYAALQERAISSTGEFPVIGRSITYRTGVFHLLADAARRGLLPEGVRPEAVRCALTAVQERTLGAPATFAPGGWLRIGLAGHQPSLGEAYISTGSLYLCSAVWLPLGLAPAHPFWSGPPAEWTAQRVWSGQDAHADHALSE